MENSSAQFDAEDLALLETARLEREAEVGNENVVEEVVIAAAPALPAPAAPAPAPVAAAPAPVAAPVPAVVPAAQAPAAPAAPAPAPVDAPAAPAPQPGGDVRAALRASRFAERQATQRAEQLAQELEAARKLIPSTQATLDAATKADLAQYAPEAATHIERLERENAELARKAATAAPAPAPAAFAPPRLPADTQAVVDEIPALLELQYNPDQTGFTLAKRFDAVLEVDPAWKDKPVQERFAEAARQALERLGQSTAATPPPPSAATVTDAEKAAAIAKAQAAAGATQVLSIGDLRGGATAAPEEPDYSKMNDEDIMASL